MDAIDGLTFGPVSTEGRGDTCVMSTPVLFENQQIGTIQQVGKMLLSWMPASNQRGVTIPEMTAFSQDALLHTVQRLIARQLPRLDADEALTEQDTDPLDPELREYMAKSDFMGEVLKHPLVFGVPYNCTLAPHYNDQLRYKKAAVQAAIDRAEWGSYIALHERPYRLHAFVEISYELDDPTYWEMVGDWWTDSENIHQNFDDWLDLWSADRLDRDLAMDEEERAALAAMPEVLTIYRGYQHSASKLGMSWTLDQQRAEWFAQRFRRSGHDAWVATAKVYLTDVLAYFTGRGEAEIVVLPDDLFDVSSEKVVDRKPAG